jgi:Na+/H+ antiporter NhaD/arsenite permease-like protein
MLIGAILSIGFVNSSIVHIISSIKWDIIFYLIGVFLIVEAAESSGFLNRVTNTLFSRFNNPKHILATIIFIFGILSALVLNDTTAIIGVPVIIKLCKNNKKLLSPYMLALAFAITIGSVFSPIGNPQNLLIASQLDSPFIVFAKHLSIPTIICLIIEYFIIYAIYKRVLDEKFIKISLDSRTCKKSAYAVKVSILLFLLYSRYSPALSCMENIT